MSTTTITAADTYELQAAARLAESRFWDAQHEIKNGLGPSPQFEREMNETRAAVTAAQDALGGRVFRVADINLDGLTKKVDKINRRAAKLGVDPIVLTVTGETWDRKVIENGLVKEIIPFTYVVLSTNVVKLNGYQFAATIEHDEDGNVVRTVPGVEGDFTRFRTAPALCEKCNTVRNRIDTFVVLHEDGHTKQIGRNCLVDFLGSDATRAAQSAEWVIDLEDAFNEAEDVSEAHGPRAIKVVDVEEFLTHVALFIRLDKWQSRGTAREWGGRATADAAENNLAECQRKFYAAPGVKDHHVLPEPQDAEAAAAALAWAREEFGSKAIDDRSDFEHNMAVSVAKDYVPTRRLGFAAYAVQGHRKSIETEVKAKATKKADDAPFIVEVKGKVTVDVTLARVNEISDRYSYNDSTKPLYEFVTAEGSIVKWFSSRWIDGLTAGESYKLTGTVKEHNDGTDKYTGDKRYPRSTVLTRCKVL